MSPNGTNSHRCHNREAKISSQAAEPTVPDLLIGGLPGVAGQAGCLVGERLDAGAASALWRPRGPPQGANLSPQNALGSLKATRSRAFWNQAFESLVWKPRTQYATGQSICPLLGRGKGKARCREPAAWTSPDALNRTNPSLPGYRRCGGCDLNYLKWPPNRLAFSNAAVFFLCVWASPVSNMAYFKPWVISDWEFQRDFFPFLCLL